MERSKPKRVTIKLNCPNPLFEKWLMKWRDQAKESESKMQHCFSLALKSLQKYPLPLETGKDCKVLRGFGDKLCKMLDDKLVKYKNTVRSTSNIDTQTISLDHVIQAASDNCESPKKKPAKRRLQSLPKPPYEKVREYVPQYGSGPYAILVALYKLSLEINFPGYSSKTDVIRIGQPFCNTSFTKPDPGNRYTAWSSMRTLLEKKLVHKESNPAKFSLTDEGIVLAHKLVTKSRDINNIQVDNIEDHSNVCVAVSNEVVDKHEKIGSGESFSTRDNKLTRQPSISDSSTSTKSKKIWKQTSSSSIASTQSSTSDSIEETVFFTPYSFEIILLVDTQETSGKKTNPADEPIIIELTKLNVNFEIRHLKVGDFTWICRNRLTKAELVLPYILERKRMDDFGKSIKDGRFHEQKFRLKQCGIQNLIYLIESYGSNEHHLGLPLSTLYQAAMNTMVQDNFKVKFTENLRGTAQYLSQFTSLLKKYLEKTLMSCTRENLSPSTLEDDLIPLMTFKEFSKGAAKNKQLKVKDLYVRQLLQIKGMSVDKALALVEKYPSPKHLKLAYDQKTPNEAEKLLSSIQFGKLKKSIGLVLSKTVFQLYTLKSF